MSKNPQPARNPVYESFCMCFKNLFTLDEMIKYMMDKHGDALTEETIKRMFERLILGSHSDSDYIEQAEARSVERKMLTQAHAWSRDQKMAVLNDRLSILPKETRDLVNTLSQLEKDTLCFFITREFLTKEGAPTYARNITHRTCFHCHCLMCYSTFYRILGYLGNRQLIERIMDSVDVAAESLRLQEISEKNKEEKKERAGKKNAGK